MTRDLLRRLEGSGDISSYQVKVFYSAAREFYSTAATYALANFPFEDSVLKNAQFTDINKRDFVEIMLEIQILFYKFTNMSGTGCKKTSEIWFLRSETCN